MFLKHTGFIISPTMKHCLLIGAAVAAMVFAGVTDSSAEKLVILHTNDTHSQIDPNDKDQGGILRRKVLVDSVRAVEPNVLLLDAGDAVQGSLFFTLFDGEVEQKMLNELGYDVQIVGNHEFDNGLDKLAAQYKGASATLLATNYDFTGTPLEGMFSPYIIKEIAGKRIGILAVNVDPKGLIDRDNFAGMKYFDELTTANAMARYLKENMGVDLVIALSHIGYGYEKGTDDREVAAGSSDIDIIIGGHSHDAVYPGNPRGYETVLENRLVHPVQIAQMGKSGLLLGEITIDFDKPEGERISARAIPVDNRLDSQITEADRALLAPYRWRVDSISAIRVGESAIELPSDSPQLRNLLSDWVKTVGERLAGRKVDFALLNKGGIRNSLPKGTLTQGNIINMLPFNNRVVVVELKGDRLLALMDTIASQSGQAVSRQVKGTFDRKASKMKTLKINGKDIDPEKIYTISTIDYLWRGGDSMTPLTESTLVVKSPNLLYRDLINEFEPGGAFHGVALNSKGELRLKPAK